MTTSATLRAAGFAAALLAPAALAPTPALAWGHTGHLWISQLATLNLPAEVPAFLRSQQAVAELGELGAELDVSKTTGDYRGGSYPGIYAWGALHDFERDQGHFIDLNDDGSAAGLAGTAFSIGVNGANPNGSRRDFDTALRFSTSTDKLSGANATQYGVGYLPYAIIDGWQQVRKDFGYIRAFTKAIATATTPADKAFFQYQLQLRQTLTLRDVGVWSHYVADGSQPLHVSIHYNGWGSYPNPNGYTTDPIHAPFEGTLVKNNLTRDYVAQKLAAIPASPCDGCAIETLTVTYLKQTLATVTPLYQLYNLGPKNKFATPTASELDFAATRLAAGAAELRDLIVDAWRASATSLVGYPLVKVQDIESGAVVFTPTMFAGD